MTLIELYDRTPVENIITTLALKPRKVIFIGSDTRRIKKSIPLCQEIVRGRGMDVEMIARSVAKNDLEAITEVLYDVLLEEEDDQIVVDISGGDESTLVSVGMILGNCSQINKKLYAFRINIVSRRGVLFEIQKAENGRMHIDRRIYDFSVGSQVYLTVEENIVLHGGKILSKGIPFPRGDKLAEDVRTMWKLCRVDCTGWNAKLNVLSGAVIRFEDEDGKFMLPKSAFGKKRHQVDEKLWNAFVEAGLVTVDAQLSDKMGVVFSYKNKIVEECLNKAGSSLEYITYLSGMEATAEEEWVFDDAQIGVVIDWDGEPNGTSNEIDCIFMRGMVPVFVSCKNGDVKTDELYKLDAVSEKFGSGYAKAALVSTVYFDPHSRSYEGERATENLKNRADDMQIRLLTKVHTLSYDRIGSDLARLVT